MIKIRYLSIFRLLMINKKKKGNLEDFIFPFILCSSFYDDSEPFILDEFSVQSL